MSLGSVKYLGSGLTVSLQGSAPGAFYWVLTGNILHPADAAWQVGLNSGSIAAPGLIGNDAGMQTTGLYWAAGPVLGVSVSGATALSLSTTVVQSPLQIRSTAAGSAAAPSIDCRGSQPTAYGIYASASDRLAFVHNAKATMVRCMTGGGGNQELQLIEQDLSHSDGIAFIQPGGVQRARISREATTPDLVFFTTAAVEHMRLPASTAYTICIRDVNISSPSTNLLRVATGDRMEVAAGGSAANYARVGGRIANSVTVTGNVGAGEDTLIDLTVPAATFAVNGDTLQYHTSFAFATNANNKQVRFYFGDAASLINIYASGAQAQNGGNMVVDITVVRAAAGTQRITIRIGNSASSLFTTETVIVATGENDADAWLIRATGEATADNDIQQIFATLNWTPAAP